MKKSETILIVGLGGVVLEAVAGDGGDAAAADAVVGGVADDVVDGDEVGGGDDGGVFLDGGLFADGLADAGAGGGADVDFVAGGVEGVVGAVEGAADAVVELDEAAEVDAKPEQ